MSEEGDIVGDIFGWVGTCISTFFFITPVVPFLKLVKGEITYKESPGVLLICSFMNCILWADYGLIHDRFLQYFPNGLGGSITLVFITIFLIFLAEKRLSFVLLYLGCLGIAILGISFLFYRIVRVDITGIVANIFNVLMYAAPGEKIYTVFKTGNYELIPIWSTFGACACSASWLIYGIYLPDWLVIIPNLLGVICAILEIIIYYIFKGKAKKNDVDGGLTQEE
jgi:solute carrier family 50 protein (sugar transporter)